ncbi:MAG: carboxypeptidase-like regulatory domain-containing protein [Saprospiraceae bacterium]
MISIRSVATMEYLPRLILSSAFLFLSLIGFAQQSINGTVNTSDNKELSYVNIGIVGTTTGTVSDDHGKFTLYLNAVPKATDTLRFSRIGYKSQSFALVEISEELNVLLEEEAFELDEIVVKPKFSNTKVSGRTKVKGKMHVNFSIAKKPRQNLGSEIGKKFKVRRKRTTQVEVLRFYIKNNNFSSAKFRVQFYSVKRGKPHKLLSDRDIIVNVNDKKTGWVEVDLRDYEVLTKKNFIATLQWIDASSDGTNLAMPINLPVIGSHHYYKFGAQAKWKHFRNMSATMNVTLAY